MKQHKGASNMKQHLNKTNAAWILVIAFIARAEEVLPLVENVLPPLMELAKALGGVS